MIVVAIIAVLLAMAAYSFTGIRNRIRKTSCRENMRIIRKAFFLAQTENPSLTDKDLTIDKLLKPGYLKTRPICPSGGRYWISNEDENTRVTCVREPEPTDHGYIE